MRCRIAEVNQHTIAHIPGDEAPEAAHGLGDARLIGRNDLAQVLRIHACGERRRTDKVREHHGDLAALGGVSGGFVGCRGSVGKWRWCARSSAQSSDGVEQLATIPDKSDSKILQVLRRQTRQDRVVDLVLAEGCLIMFEAKLPQPTSEFHGGALLCRPLHDPPGETVCLANADDRFGSKTEVCTLVRNVRAALRSRHHQAICSGPVRPVRRISHHLSAHSPCCSSTASCQRLLNSSSTNQPAFLPRDLSLPRRSR